jgi:integrase
MSERELSTPVNAQDRVRTTRWMEDLPCLGLRYHWSGRKSWVVQTRIEGRSRTVTLGSAAVLNASVARQRAKLILAKSELGGDPASDKLAVRTIPTFQAFLDEYWDRAEPRWKPSTQRTHRVYRRLYLDTAFTGLCVDQITYTDVQAWFRKTTDVAGPGGANRAFAILKAMFRKAEAWGYRPDGSMPSAEIRQNRARKMQRFLSAQELSRLGEALKIEAKTRPTEAAAIRLILLTGCRSSEILQLTWGEVRGHRLRLNDSKTGPRTVWLGDEAKAALAMVARHEGVDRIFYSFERRRPISRVNKCWYAVRERAGLPGVRLHDLRHTYASQAAGMSETLPMIGRLLGHAQLRSTARYAHLDDHEVLKVAERLGAKLEGLLG